MSINTAYKSVCISIKTSWFPAIYNSAMKITPGLQLSIVPQLRGKLSPLGSCWFVLVCLCFSDLRKTHGSLKDAPYRKPAEGENVSTLRHRFVFPPSVRAVTLPPQRILSWSPLCLAFFKKKRWWAKPFIQRQVVSIKSLNVCEVCIPEPPSHWATSKDRLLTVVSELISSYKDWIGVIAAQSSAFLIASRCWCAGKGETQEDPGREGGRTGLRLSNECSHFSPHCLLICDFPPCSQGDSFSLPLGRDDYEALSHCPACFGSPRGPCLCTYKKPSRGQGPLQPQPKATWPAGAPGQKIRGWKLTGGK